MYVSSGMSNSMNDMSNFYLIFSVIQAIAVSAYANFRSSVSSAIKDQNFGVFFWGGGNLTPPTKQTSPLFVHMQLSFISSIVLDIYERETVPTWLVNSLLNFLFAPL